MKRLVLALLLAGCASGFAAPPPVVIGPPPPDLRGVWSGTWAGTPVTLAITEQFDLAPYSGMYMGTLHVLGPGAPGVAGVLTSTIGGQPVSASMKGWLGSTGTAVTVLLQARTSHGTQQLSLTRTQADRLVGSGESDFPWGPKGQVELSRRPAT